jgi:hypothetical protein
MVDLVSSASAGSFVYLPPDAAFGAARTLVVTTASQSTLRAILRGLRRATPVGRIVVIAEPDSVADLLDREMRAAPLSEFIMADYDGLSAPAYFADYDCCIVAGTADGDDDSPALAALVTAVSAPADVTGDQVAAALAPHIAGAVVEIPGERVIWGADLAAVDAAARRHTGGIP